MQKADHSLLHRRSEASQYLKNKWGVNYAARTLAKYACLSSDGPEMHYVGRIPYYSEQGLDEFALKRIGPACRSTSDRGVAVGVADHSAQGCHPAHVAPGDPPQRVIRQSLGRVRRRQR